MHYFEEPSGDNPKYPCGVCNRLVKDEHKAVQCDVCNFWNHIKCDKVDLQMYENLKKSKDPYICYNCKLNIMPFQNLTNEQFITTSFRGSDIDIDDYNDLNILPPNILKSFVNDINDANQSKGNDDDETPINCQYYGADSSLPKIGSKKYFSLFHMNIASLELHKEELQVLLSILDIEFNVLAITETKLKKCIVPTYDYNLPGYNCFQTPAESEKGGALLYIEEKFISKRREDLEKLLYKPDKLESVFVELINNDGKNSIIGCIYRHPSMEIEDFNSNYFNMAMNKITNENKNVFLTGDFNIDLMKTGDDTYIDNFFELITTNLMVPHITIPTRITHHSKTLIDNIFSNSINFSQAPEKHNLFKRDFENFDRENFVADLINIDWNSVLSIEKGDPNHSFNMFDIKINELMQKYVPLKKLTKKDFKYQLKPWISTGILKSIKRRDKLIHNFINAKELPVKERLRDEYKKKGILLSL